MVGFLGVVCSIRFPKGNLQSTCGLMAHMMQPSKSALEIGSGTTRSLRAFSGLRILGQPFDEDVVLLPFEFGQEHFPNQKLRRGGDLRYGEKLGFGIGSFPGWNRLCEVRKRNSRGAAWVSGEIELRGWQTFWPQGVVGLRKPLPFLTEKAKTRLMEMPGVGQKIADCSFVRGGKTRGFSNRYLDG